MERPGMSDMAGNAARVTVERRGSSRDTNADIRKAKQLVGIWTLD